MKNNRRTFLQKLGVSGLAFTLPFQQDAYPAAEENGFVRSSDEHETYLIAGRQDRVTIMVDKNKNGIGTMSLCKEEIKPGEGIPVHKHLNEAESIYIQQGSGVFTLYDKEYPVQAGSAAFVPKGVWHGLQNTGSELLVMVFSFSPSGFEGYFREIGVPPGVAWKQKTNEEFAAAAKKYGIQYRDF